MASSIIPSDYGQKVKTRDFTFSSLNGSSLASLTANAIIGCKVTAISDNAKSAIPTFFNYGANLSNWNIRWVDRNTGSIIDDDTSTSVSITVFYF